MGGAYSIPNPKINPGKRRPDNTPDDDDRTEIGPTPQAYREWAEAGLTCPDLQAMRQFRWERMTRAIQQRDLGGLLMFDPLSVRYVTDTTNMQLWATHNQFRACLLLADGHMVLWDYSKNGLHSKFNPLVAETRGKASFFYFATGDRTEERAEIFTRQVDELLRAHAGNNRRLAVDKIMVHGVRALDKLGIEIVDGEEVAERTRAIKGPDDIKAMRCAMHACELAVAEMREVAVPGVTENEIWAELHRGNIVRGGEWIETRILASGPRTNPWFQECGPRVVGNNELVSWDSDLIGCYGICTDISRSWFIGDGEPSREQKRLHRVAYDHIQQNMELLQPGVTFKEITEGGHQLPEEFVTQRYGCKMHGVGMCDEWPLISYPQSFAETGYDGVIEAGMVLCVEAYIGAVGGRDGIKLEDQVLVTDTGYENLTKCPFDPKLMA